MPDADTKQNEFMAALFSTHNQTDNIISFKFTIDNNVLKITDSKISAFTAILLESIRKDCIEQSGHDNLE